MSSTPTSTQARSVSQVHSRYRWPSTFWGIALLLSALYISAEASRYLWLPPTRYPFELQRSTYADHGVIMMMHIGAGIVALIAGALQFVPQLKRYRRGHRAIGLLYVTAVMVSAATGLRAAAFSFGGAPTTAAFRLWSCLWMFTTAMAVIQIARGRVHAHQRWMKRSFAITLAAITLRIELGVLIYFGGLSFREAYPVVSWTSWILNLLVVEWWPAVTRFTLPANARSTRSKASGEFPDTG